MKCVRNTCNKEQRSEEPKSYGPGGHIIRFNHGLCDECYKEFWDRVLSVPIFKIHVQQAIEKADSDMGKLGIKLGFLLNKGD